MASPIPPGRLDELCSDYAAARPGRPPPTDRQLLARYRLDLARQARGLPLVLYKRDGWPANEWDRVDAAIAFADVLAAQGAPAPEELAAIVGPVNGVLLYSV